MSEHTKTPYCVGRSNGNHRTVICTDPENPAVSAVAFTVCREGRDIADAEHDADFIVRACNAHDALVKACEEIVTAFNPNTRGSAMDVLLVVAQARAALAKAKGGAA